MKSLLNNRLVAVITLTMLFIAARGFASEGGGGMEKAVDGLTIHLSFMDEDARIGSNTVMISLMDANHTPLEEARVTVTAEMAGDMAGMAGMEPPESLQAEPRSDHDKGQYMAVMNLTDEGKWKISLHIDALDKETNADFIVEVLKTGPNWHVLLGFAGIITAIIVAAAINKMRKTVRR